MSWRKAEDSVGYSGAAAKLVMGRYEIGIGLALAEGAAEERYFLSGRGWPDRDDCLCD